MTKKLQIGVKAIIFNKNKFLLIKRSKKYGKKLTDQWDFPGGRIKIGEDLEKGLQREVKEEVGNIRFNIIKPIHVCTVVNDSRRQVVRITYECEYVDGNVRLSHEHIEHNWFGKDKLPKELDSLVTKEAIGNLGT